MCNKCNGNCNSCDCTCNQVDCSCKVLISTDCVTLSEDLTCSGIIKGQTETEVLKQLDAYICARFESVENFFQIINVGGGYEVYKGVTALGKKELRTLVDSNLINLVQGTDTITISVDETVLNTFIEANQKTYSAVNIGTGAQVYKNSTVVGDNTQFNLRKIRSSDNSVTITEGVDDIDVIAPLPPLEKVNEDSGLGIIIRGRNAANYGNVGSKAVDLSDSFNASSTRGATGAYSFAANDSTTASDYASVAFGIETIASAQGAFVAGSECIASGLGSAAFGMDSEASGSTAFASGFVTIASGQSSNATNERTSAQGDWSSASGYNTDAIGRYSYSGGQENYAGSYAETSIGYFGTQNFSENATSVVSTDRLFNIGNGTNNFTRSNAFTILKNGLATLPSVTNALITADSGKAIITKEYFNAFAALDTNVVHKTGSETITGIKTFNGATGVAAIEVNTTAGYGVYLTANGTGVGMQSVGYSTSNIINLSILGTGRGINFYNPSSGTAIYGENTDVGNAIVINGAVGSTGKLWIGQDNNITTSSIDKLGNITANSFVKTGGTSSQYLMADGSVSTASSTIQSVIVIGGWAINQGYVVDTTIGTGKTIISITSTLICTIANNGYAVGDIVSISPTQSNDSGGLSDSGVSVRWRADTSDRFTFNVNDRIDIPNCYNGGVGTGGVISDPVGATSGQWNMRHVILYI